MKKIQLLISDDHRLFRETLSLLINEDERFCVTAMCCSNKEAVEAVKDKQPDIVLMGINLLPFEAIAATTQICKSGTTEVIAMSMHAHPMYAKKMISVGAKGYVTKNTSVDEIFTAIVDVKEGKRYVCDEIKNRLADYLFTEKSAPQELLLLSEREIVIINFIKGGLSSKEIAAALNLSNKTIEVHRHNILRKLKLHNTPSLINFINHHPDAEQRFAYSPGKTYSNASPVPEVQPGNFIVVQ